MRLVIVLLLGAATLGGCDLSMKQQAKAGAQSSPELWPGGPARQAPPVPGQRVHLGFTAQDAVVLPPGRPAG